MIDILSLQYLVAKIQETLKLNEETLSLKY